MVRAAVELTDPLHTVRTPSIAWSRVHIAEAQPGVHTPLSWSWWDEGNELAVRGPWLDAGVSPMRKQAGGGVEDRVVFHGFVDEDTKHRLLAQSWLMVMPSQKEGWGLTIVEAGTHSVPAVAFRDSGGPTESIVSGETGRLADSFEEMTEQVAALLADPCLRTKYGANALAHATSFDWSTSAERLGEVLVEVARPRT